MHVGSDFSNVLVQFLMSSICWNVLLERNRRKFEDKRENVQFYGFLLGVSRQNILGIFQQLS